MWTRCASHSSDRRAPREARHALRDFLATVACPEQLREDMLLVVSELVTNAVVHARSDPIVVAMFDDGRLRIEVYDDDRSPPTVTPRRDPMAASGYVWWRRSPTRGDGPTPSPGSGCGSRRVCRLGVHERDVRRAVHAERSPPRRPRRPGGRVGGWRPGCRTQRSGMSDDSMIIDAHAGDDLSSLAGDWEVDPSHSALEFVCRYAMFTLVRGRFTSFSGTAVLDPLHPEATEISVDIDPSSVDTSMAVRDEHLRGGDFFDVERHPTITFRSRGVTLLGAGRYVVQGDLTIRGLTQPVRLTVDLFGRAPDVQGNPRLGFKATTRLQRSRWNITGTPRCSAVASPSPTTSTWSWTCRSSRPGRSAGRLGPTRRAFDRSVGGRDTRPDVHPRVPSPADGDRGRPGPAGCSAISRTSRSCRPNSSMRAMTACTASCVHRTEVMPAPASSSQSTKAARSVGLATPLKDTS